MRNGYALHFSGPASVAGTERLVLDPLHPEVAKLSAGFTLMMWLRFSSLDPLQTQRPFSLVHAGDDFFFQPFGGTHGGFQFGEGGVGAVKSLGRDALEWHHYTESWEVATGERRVYIDGVRQPDPPSRHDGRQFIDKQVSFHIGMHCYIDNYLDPSATQIFCSSASYFTAGEMDDLALFSTALTPSEVAHRWNSSLAHRLRTGLEPNLPFFYDFEPQPAASTTRAPNLGTAGHEYDLILGRLPKDGVLGEYFRPNGQGEGIVRLRAPIRVPRSASAVGRHADPQAPLVLLASADASEVRVRTGTGDGDVRTIRVVPAANASAGASAGTAADGAVPWQVERLSDAEGEPLEVHVCLVPRPLPPPNRTAAERKMYSLASVVEDSTVRVQLWGINAAGSASPLVLRVTQLPRHGRLFKLPPEGAFNHEASPVASSELLPPGMMLLYMPNKDESGIDAAIGAFDAFDYELVIRDFPSLPPARAHMLVEMGLPINDKASVTAPPNVSVLEDGPPRPIDLGVFDVEQGQPLDLVVSSLPALGHLYQVPSEARMSETQLALAQEYMRLLSQEFDTVGAEAVAATLAAEGHDAPVLITRKYNAFASEGTPISKYVSSVLGVSSFWGSPPYSGYHPLNIVGPPDCDTYGECHSWEELRPGQLVRHKDILAQLNSTGVDDEGVQVYLLDLMPMYRRDDSGTIRRCVMRPGAGNEYPMDCSFETAPEGDARVRWMAPMDEVLPQEAAVWSPLYQQRRTGLITADDSIAYGPQYEFKHDQDAFYAANQPKSTEYIDVAIDAPLHLLTMQIGMPRGMGAVSRIRARRSDESEFFDVFAGGASVGRGDRFTLARLYDNWLAPICRPHKKVDVFRIEIDTSLDSGVLDWNYIDAVQVWGSEELQPGALFSSVSRVWYVPFLQQAGLDEIQVQATDCSGDLQRLSDPVSIPIIIEPVNDAPIAGGSWPEVVFFGSKRVLDLPVSDGDGDDDALQISVTALPVAGRLYESCGSARSCVRITAVPHTLSRGERRVVYEPTTEVPDAKVQSGDELIPALKDAEPWLQLQPPEALEQLRVKIKGETGGSGELYLDGFEYEVIDEEGALASGSLTLIIYSPSENDSSLRLVLSIVLPIVLVCLIITLFLFAMRRSQHSRLLQAQTHCARIRKGQGGRVDPYKLPIVSAPMLARESPVKFHAFLSYCWDSGQTQAEALNHVLQRRVHRICPFIDLANLEDLGELERHVRESMAVLVVLTGSVDPATGTPCSSYMSSVNCLRELRTAAECDKPIVLIHEGRLREGGVPLEVHYEACPPELRAAVLTAPVIPWYREVPFQMCSVTVLIEELLKAWGTPLAEHTCVTLPDALLASPRRELYPIDGGYHLFVSQHNEGAAEVLQMVSRMEGVVKSNSNYLTFIYAAGDRSSSVTAMSSSTTWRNGGSVPEDTEGGGIRAVEARKPPLRRQRRKKVGLSGVAPTSTHDPKHLLQGRAEQFLLYLNERTHASGEKTVALQEEVHLALQRGMRLLLVHEQRPDYGRISFDDIIKQTPMSLLNAGIYKMLAVPLHPLPHLHVSLRLIWDDIGKPGTAAAKQRQHNRDLPRGHRYRNLSSLVTVSHFYNYARGSWSNSRGVHGGSRGTDPPPAGHDRHLAELSRAATCSNLNTEQIRHFL